MVSLLLLAARLSRAALQMSERVTNELHNSLQRQWQPQQAPATTNVRRAASDHTATMWLNKNGLLQPDDVIVYCIQSTQYDVS